MKKQQDFFRLNRDFAPGRIAHGGDSGVGKRKLARPFKRHCPMHLVLKSDNAKGRLSMLTASNQISVARILQIQAQKFGVKIHKEQNVGNHLHCIVSCGRREQFANFLRAVSGLIARAILKGKQGKFWTQIPFTRLINGARDYAKMFNYIAKNYLEANFGKAARVAVETEEERVRKERRNAVARKRRSG